MKNLPDRNFYAEPVYSWKNVLSCRDLWGQKSSDPKAPIPIGLNDIVLEESPLNEVTYATLFTYMQRRFGASPFGSDDYKDLCGGWMLRTPSPSLLVMVTPAFNGAYFCFRPVYLRSANDDKKAHYIEELNLPRKMILELKSAYKKLLLDLLRPVCVRDAFFNAVGEVSEDSALMKSNRDGDLIYKADFHESAGYGVPPGLVGCDAYPLLCNMLIKEGKGNIAKGATAVLKLLHEPAMEEAAAAPLPVKRLIVMGLDKYSELARSLGLTQKEVNQFKIDDALIQQYAWGLAQGGKRATQVESLLEETTDQVLKMAIGLLDRLGIGGEFVAETFSTALTNWTTSAAWADLHRVSNGEFPEDIIKDIDGLDGKKVAALVRSRLKKAGHSPFVAWVDKTLSRPRGIEAFHKLAIKIEMVEAWERKKSKPDEQAATKT